MEFRKRERWEDSGKKSCKISRGTVNSFISCRKATWPLTVLGITEITLPKVYVVKIGRFNREKAFFPSNNESMFYKLIQILPRSVNFDRKSDTLYKNWYKFWLDENYPRSKSAFHSINFVRNTVFKSARKLLIWLLLRGSIVRELDFLGFVSIKAWFFKLLFCLKTLHEE